MTVSLAGMSGTIVAMVVLARIGIFNSLTVSQWIAAAITIWILLCYLLLRRFEYIADCEGARLTGDATAQITSLVALTRLNQLPLRWGKWDSALITHPAALHRVQRIARQNGMAPAQLQEILDSPRNDSDRYTVPSAAERKEQVFSTTSRRWLLFRLYWGVIGSRIAVLVLTDFFVRQMHWSGGLMWTGYVIGAAAAVALSVTLNTHLQYRFYRKCEQKWRARLLTEGIDASAAIFVKFAPQAQPRLYEQFSHWDIGLLLLAGSRLCYIGEQTRFELRRDEVVDAHRGIAVPRAFQSDACVYVSWRNAETGQDGSFHLSPSNPNSFMRSHAALDALEKAIARWRAVHVADERLPSSDLPKPGVGAVTSISFRQAASASVIARAIHINGAIAAAGCVLAGLPLLGRGALYVILLVAGSMVTEWIAYSRCDDKVRSQPQVNPESGSCQPSPS